MTSSVILLGQGRRTNDQNFNLKTLKSNLKAFKEGEKSIVISTSVIQEGVDVKNCDASTTSCGASLIQLSGRP